MLSISGAYKPLLICIIGGLLLFSIGISLLPSTQFILRESTKTKKLIRSQKAKTNPLFF